ncbi:hypothetical protein ACSSS7_000006 [Eimeria intestinalis]
MADAPPAWLPKSMELSNFCTMILHESHRFICGREGVIRIVDTLIHIKFQLGLQSVLAAEEADDTVPLDPLASDGEDGCFYKLVDENLGGVEAGGGAGGTFEEPFFSGTRPSDDNELFCASEGKSKEAVFANCSGNGKDVGLCKESRDPPHREMVSRFQKLKAIRHPHLCAYTNVLRIKRRVYAVSEHWSLSLQDILDAWDAEGRRHTPSDDHQGEACSSEGPAVAGKGRKGGAATSCASWDVKKLEFLGLVVGQTLAALAHLNSMGFSHSRLEPRTIRIDAWGNVRLSEWGLGYLTDGGRLAPSADILPSFSFLAPEQVLSGPEVLREATAFCSKHDVWALGIILLRVLQPDWFSSAAPHAPQSHTPQCCCRPGVEGPPPSSPETDGQRQSEGPRVDREERVSERGTTAASGSGATWQREAEAVTQLVLYSALGVDHRVLLPLEPPRDDEDRGSHGGSKPPPTVAPTLTAFGSELSLWALQRSDILMDMMEKAAREPCRLLHLDRLPRGLSFGEGGQQEARFSPPMGEDPGLVAKDSAAFAEGNPLGTPAAAGAEEEACGPSRDGESAFYRRLLKQFTRWLSGASLCQRAHFHTSRFEAPDKEDESLKTSYLSDAGGGLSSEADAAGGGPVSDVEANLQAALKEAEEILAACLTVHPSSRPSPSDLLAFAWVQKAQLDRQLWVAKGAEAVALLADLHIDEELKRVFEVLQEKEEEQQDDSYGTGDEVSMRALPWLPYSRLESGNHLNDLLRNHNIGVDEVFYWWQLQGGDVHASLRRQGAFLPVPSIFSLPLCCLEQQSSGRSSSQLSTLGGPSTPSLSRVDFLAAFADNCLHDDTQQGLSCSCRRRCSSPFSLTSSEGLERGETFQGRGPTRAQNGKQQAGERGGSSGVAEASSFQHSQNDEQERRVSSASARRKTDTELEDTFFSSGFTGHRNWRDVHLWKEGDVRVFGVSLDETLRAIREADRFPVGQMLEVRPPCIYRRQCHFLYQRLRVRLFKSLLAQLPKSRHRLMEEAARDVPPLLRPEIWAALLGVNQVGVLHTEQLSYEDAALSLGSLSLEALQTSEFSQYHEPALEPEHRPGLGAIAASVTTAVAAGATAASVKTAAAALATPALAAVAAQWGPVCVHRLKRGKTMRVGDNMCVCVNPQYHDLLGSCEGRRRLLTLVGVILQRSPSYVCMRGLDALAAPFLLLYYDQESVALACLERMLKDFQHQFFAADNASFLRLHSDMYALSWHLTLFSHVLPLQQLLLLWDSLLLQPPTFVHFLTVCILHFLREPLLSLRPGEESTAVRLLQTCFEFLNIPALCASATALLTAVPWALAMPPALLSPSADGLEMNNNDTCKEEKTKPTGTALPTGATGHQSPQPSLSSGSESTTALCSVISPRTDEAAGVSASGGLSQPVSFEAQQFFIGEGEDSPQSQLGSERSISKSISEDLPQMTSSGTSMDSSASTSSARPLEGAPKKTSSSWKSRALMSVIKGPALMLLGAPRKPNISRALQSVETDGETANRVDPMEALYSNEPLASRWWTKMNESVFLQTTSSAWQADGMSSVGESKGGGGHDAEAALQPACIGVDALLHFHQESVVLDVRQRPNFESLRFVGALHVTPRDVRELIALLKEGQATLPDPRGVILHAQKLGSTPRPKLDLVARVSLSASAEGMHAAPDITSSLGGGTTPEAAEVLHAKGGQGQAVPAGVMPPWISAKMNRLPLIVVVGDKEDSGSGLARRLLKAGISCVCVLLGGVEALQLDAPSDFLVGKYFK